MGIPRKSGKMDFLFDERCAQTAPFAVLLNLPAPLALH